MAVDFLSTPDHLDTDTVADLYCSDPNTPPSPLQVALSTMDFLGHLAGLGVGLIANAVNSLHDKIDSM